MSTPVPPPMRSLRVLLSAVLTALSIPVVLAAGAALPPGAVLAGAALAIFVGAVVRTLSWVADEPTGDRATALAVTSGLGAGAAAVILSVFAVLAGPVALVLVPLVTAAGVTTWWVGRPAL